MSSTLTRISPATVAGTAPVRGQARSRPSEVGTPPASSRSTPKDDESRKPALADTGRTSVLRSIREALVAEIEAAARSSLRQGIRVDTMVHEQTGRYVIRVLDSESGEVIREFPPIEVLDAVAMIEEVGGSIFDGEM